MVFQEPKKWLSWLSLAEWWYNTTYHTSLKCTPFEALYGYQPPLIIEVMIPGPDSAAVEFLTQKHSMISRLKGNLAQAQARTKKYADLKRSEREFQVGDMVYLRLHPFRTNAFGIHQSFKLATRYYGPFKILEKIGQVAYKLQLPVLADIHPIFHVSQLKQHLGSKAVPQANFPLVTNEGYIKTEPTEVLETWALPRNDEIVTQWRVNGTIFLRTKLHGRTSSLSRRHSLSFTEESFENGGQALLLVEKKHLKGGGCCHDLVKAPPV
jgi:hypothetical protein